MRNLSDISGIEPDDQALELIPESVARELSILLVSVEADSIYAIVATEQLKTGAVDKLQFLLNERVAYDTAPQSQIDAKIAQYYPRPGKEPWALDEVGVDLPDSIPEFKIGSEFQILDFVGRVETRSQGSVVFTLGRWSDRLRTEDSEATFDHKCVFHVVGWLDAHFPCSGQHKLFVRGKLPAEHANWETLSDLIRCVAGILALPASVSFTASVDSPEGGITMAHPLPQVFD